MDWLIDEVVYEAVDEVVDWLIDEAVYEVVDGVVHEALIGGLVD